MPKKHSFEILAKVVATGSIQGVTKVTWNTSKFGRLIHYYNFMIYFYLTYFYDKLPILINTGILPKNEYFRVSGKIFANMCTPPPHDWMYRYVSWTWLLSYVPFIIVFMPID